METIKFSMRCRAVEGFMQIANHDCPLVLTDDRLAVITTGGDIHEVMATGERRWLARIYPPDANGVNTITVRVGHTNSAQEAEAVEDLVRDALIAFEGNPAAALTRYSKRSLKCQICGRPLSNDDSMRIGAGPECRGRQNVLAQIRQQSREWIKGKQDQAPIQTKQWRKQRQEVTS